MKDIKLEDRLIFALDVPEIDQAKDLVAELDDSVGFYKIGMELLMTGQYFDLLNWLIQQDKKVFVDLKFFDVPETVGRTIARLSDYGAPRSMHPFTTHPPTHLWLGCESGCQFKSCHL